MWKTGSTRAMRKVVFWPTRNKRKIPRDQGLRVRVVISPEIGSALQNDLNGELYAPWDSQAPWRGGRRLREDPAR